MLPHSFSAKKSDFCGALRKSPTFLRKEYVISIKVSSHAIMQKSLLQKSVTLMEKMGIYLKSCKNPQLFDLNSAFTIGLLA